MGEMVYNKALTVSAISSNPAWRKLPSWNLLDGSLLPVRIMSTGWFLLNVGTHCGFHN